MSDKEFDNVVTVNEIAEEFKIPFLQVLIEKNEKLSVNTDFMSGWVEGEDESFLFMPSVDFVPLDDGSGFKIVIIDVEMDETSRG